MQGSVVPARIEEALDGDFAFLDNPRYESHAYRTQAIVLLVHHSFSPPHPVKPTLIRVDNVRGSLVKLLPLFDSATSQRHPDEASRSHIHRVRAWERVRLCRCFCSY
jgi:UDP-3-O-[3-hydroxymyristoyl] glucosamine N-acyltransferase